MPLLKSLEKKQRIGTKVEHWACPRHTTSWTWASHLSHAPSPPPEHTPILAPFKEQAQPPPGAASKGTCLFSPTCCSKGPIKALPEFLVWPLMNFYRLRKPRTLVSNKPSHLPPSGRDLDHQRSPVFWNGGFGPLNLPRVAAPSADLEPFLFCLSHRSVDVCVSSLTSHRPISQRRKKEETITF